MIIFHILIISTILPRCFTEDYICEDHNSTKPEIFRTITEYQRTEISLKMNNWIEFTEKIFRIEPKTFIGNQSNYIRKLGLQSKEIKEIDSGAFDELYCVKILELDYNIISDINADTFRGLIKLQELDLSHNELIGISENAFSILSELLKLDLSYNNIKQLSSDSFKGLYNLCELHLEYNNILDFPSNIFKPTLRLHWLFLSNNRISVLTTPALQNLEQLDKLDISNNGISYIFEDMFRSVSKLTELDLSGNHLRNLKVRNLKISLPLLVKINLSENSWKCSDLEIILQQLKFYKILVFFKGSVKENVNVLDIGCYGPVGPDLSSTTISPDSFPKDVNYSDDSEVLKAIDNLKSYVISVLVIVMIFIIANVLLKVQFCQSFGRRGVLQFQESREDLSLPLLQR